MSFRSVLVCCFACLLLRGPATPPSFHLLLLIPYFDFLYFIPFSVVFTCTSVYAPLRLLFPLQILLLLLYFYFLSFFPSYAIFTSYIYAPLPLLLSRLTCYIFLLFYFFLVSHRFVTSYITCACYVYSRFHFRSNAMLLFPSLSIYISLDSVLFVLYLFVRLYAAFSQ